MPVPFLPTTLAGVSGDAMVPLVTVASPFEAKVLMARLGSDGVLCQLRGGVDSVYPIGDTTVLVAARDLETARQLLVPVDPDPPSDHYPDVIHLTTDDQDGEAVGSRGAWTARTWWRVAAVAAVVAMLVAATRSLVGIAT